MPKIFISSNINPTMTQIRKEIKTKLNKEGFNDVYTFETEPGSTLPVVTHYLTELAQSNICVFLIDNKKINEGVLKEYEEAKLQKIKCFYFFCTQYKRKKTQMQIDLEQKTGEKYQTVSLFSELPDAVVAAIKKEKDKIFEMYCNNILKPNELLESKNCFTPNTDIYEITTNKEITSILSSFAVKINSFTNTTIALKHLKQIIGFAKHEDLSTNDNIDFACNDFLSVLFTGKDIRSFNYQLITDELKGTNKIFENIVNIRWQAINSYFQGEFNKSIEYLSEAKNLACKHKFPQWLIQDILIDLRNIKNTNDSENGLHSIINPYQEEIYKSKEILYYPIIDRKDLELYDALFEKAIVLKQNDSPYSFEYLDWDTFFEKIVSSYFVAMCNGSLTQINMIKERLKRLLLFLFKKYELHNLCYWIIPLYMDENLSNIKSLVISSPSIFDKLSAEDCSIISDNLEKITNFKSRKFVITCKLMAVIGDYTSDDLFSEKWNYIKSSIRQHMEQKIFCDVYSDVFPFYIEQCYNRIPKEELIELLSTLIELNIDSFALLRSINRTKLLSELDSKHINVLKKCIITKISNSSDTIKIEEYVRMLTITNVNSDEISILSSYLNESQINDLKYCNNSKYIIEKYKKTCLKLMNSRNDEISKVQIYNSHSGISNYLLYLHYHMEELKFEDIEELSMCCFTELCKDIEVFPIIETSIIFLLKAITLFPDIKRKISPYINNINYNQQILDMDVQTNSYSSITVFKKIIASYFGEISIDSLDLELTQINRDEYDTIEISKLFAYFLYNRPCSKTINSLYSHFNTIVKISTESCRYESWAWIGQAIIFAMKYKMSNNNDLYISLKKILEKNNTISTSAILKAYKTTNSQDNNKLVEILREYCEKSNSYTVRYNYEKAVRNIQIN